MPAAQNIDSTIEKYGNDYGQERAYLHFDKSTYAAGETIWFKAYLMNGIYPAEESKTLYVDWTDDKGTFFLTAWFLLCMPLQQGSLIFPLTIPAKFIHVKAYTKWMLNFDSAFLYNKDIRILLKSNSGFVQKIQLYHLFNFFLKVEMPLQVLIIKLHLKPMINGEGL